VSTVDYKAWLVAQRREKDRAFARDPHGPIEDRASFDGLKYYDPDERYQVVARFAPERAPKRIVFPTSTGEEKVYDVAGQLEFELDGKPAALTAYDDGVSEGLFVPFRDATSGKETYGAGRYLHVARPEGDEALVDFNLAYNPYCAYSDAWSCPLPPAENWLNLPVRAGEKSYH
jgi:uncharacterized protein (DUF1684 family)